MSPNLKFSNITEDDEGVYRCVVTNDEGSVISDNATIVVYGELIITCIMLPCDTAYIVGPPVVTFISNNTVALEGKKVNLLCNATNDVDAIHPLRINWYKGNTLIIPNGNSVLLHNETTNASGQLKSTLILDPVNISDDGAYKCRAFNHPSLYSELITNLTIECEIACSYISCSLCFSFRCSTCYHIKSVTLCGQCG